MKGFNFQEILIKIENHFGDNSIFLENIVKHMQRCFHKELKIECGIRINPNKMGTIGFKQMLYL